MSELGKLYQEVILTHHRAPRHARPLEHPTHTASESNPLCGDRVSLSLRVVEGRLLEIGCEVRGCAICRASGSLMAEAMLGLELTEALGQSQRFRAELATAPPPAPIAPAAPPAAAPSAAAAPAATAPAEDAPGQTFMEPRPPAGAAQGPANPGHAFGALAPLLEARRFPGRRRCVSLCWEALERALAG